MLAAWERNGSQPSDRYGGTDRSKRIQVVVGPDGSAIDVSIDPNWPDVLSASEFPNALFQAYLTATQIAAAARLLASRETTDSIHRPDELNFSDMERARADFSDALAGIERHEGVRRKESDPRTTASPGQYLNVRSKNGDLVEITTGQRSLLRASTRELRDDCLAALTVMQ